MSMIYTTLTPTATTVFPQINSTNSLTQLSNDLFTTFGERTTIITSKIDPLVASCALHRETTQNPDSRITHMSLEYNTDLIEAYVTKEDIERASVIRQYYANKLLLIQLKDVELTSFRQSLSEFVNGISLTVSSDKTDYSWPSKITGLICKLPRFYEYDQELASMFKGRKFTEPTNDVIRIQFKLKLIKTLKSHRKSEPVTEYWFTDQYENVVKLSLQTFNNPLLVLWQEYLKQESISITSTSVPLKRQLDDFNYYSIKQWNIDTSSN